MKYIMLSILFVFSVYGNGKHPIFDQIVKNRPSINKKHAMQLSNIIYKYSKVYKGDARLAVAIATQETRIRNRDRKQNIIRFFKKEENGVMVKKWEVLKGTTDVCMFQFHVNTIVSHKIDPIKLKEDINYCVKWHFKLMKKKKRLCRKMHKPWACYHSKNRDLRNIYINFVERYY